jgi:hypothetical protein
VSNASICVIVPASDPDNGVTYQCLCADGYEGENCSKSKAGMPDKDKAASNVTLTCENMNCNNGACKVAAGKPPRCKCDPLFKGDFCDTYICAGNNKC